MNEETQPNHIETNTETPTETAPQNSTPVVQQAPGGGKKSRKTLGIVIACLVVLAIAGGVWLWFVMRNKTPANKPAQNTTKQTPTTSTTQPKQKQLCYLQSNIVGCYTDAAFTQTAQPKVFSGLAVNKVVPSPKDDRVALLVGPASSRDAYITDSSLTPTKIDLGAMRKNTDSLAWLADGSALVFEVAVDQTTNSRVLVKYDLQSKHFTELTSRSKLSMNPLVSGSIIAFERYIGNGVWQWYTMAIDGTNENDLGIAASYGGTIVNGALLTTNTTGKYVEVDLQTKKQTALAGDQLKAPTSTANDMITLSDGRVAFTYKQDENSLGANDTIAIVDITKNKTVTLQKSTSGLFETALLDNK